MENEVVIRRSVIGYPPNDEHVVGRSRDLRMHIPPADFRAADVPHETFVDTLGWAFLNRSFGGFWLEWGGAARQLTHTLDGVWHFTQRLRDECR